jgi:alpha-L-rhamnosidase
VRGRIVSDWKTKDGRLDLTVTIPANTTAAVYVPVADPAMIKESGKPVPDAAGITLVRVEEGRTLLEVGSGTYHFTAPL